MRGRGWWFVGVATLAVAVQSGYLLVNATPQHWDPSNHVTHAMRVARDLAASPLKGLLDAAVRDYVYYPPGYYLSTAPAFLLFGRKIPAGIAWQILYLVATLAAVRALARRLDPGDDGALAAFVYLCFPVVLGLGRMVYIENLLALQVTLCLLLLARDPGLERPGTALLLGLVAGWGQLTKWQFALLAGPAALLVVAGSAEARRSARRIGLRLAAAALVCAAVAGPWYAAHLRRVVEDVHRNAYVVVQGNLPAMDPAALAYYPQAFAWQLIGLPLSVALLCGLVAALARRAAAPGLFALAAGLVASVALVSASTHKQGRFIAPLLPLAAVLITAFLRRLPARARTPATAVVVFFSLVNAAAQTVDASALVPEVKVPIGFGRAGYVLRYGTPEWILPPASREDWALEEIFGRIRESSAAEGVEATVAWKLQDDHPYYNANTLNAYAFAFGRRASEHSQANWWVCRLPEERFYTEGQVVVGRKLEVAGAWTLPDASLVRLYRARPAPAL